MPWWSRTAARSRFSHRLARLRKAHKLTSVRILDINDVGGAGRSTGSPGELLGGGRVPERDLVDAAKEPNLSVSPFIQPLHPATGATCSDTYRTPWLIIRFASPAPLNGAFPDARKPGVLSSLTPPMLRRTSIVRGWIPSARPAVVGSDRSSCRLGGQLVPDRKSVV